MQLQDILYSQGFGTRRVCAGLIQQGLVQVYMTNEPLTPVTIAQAAMEFEATGLRFKVQGVDWPYVDKAYILLHKPAATECSQKPSTYPSIYTLLPAPLRQRPQKGAVQGVQAVGYVRQGNGQPAPRRLAQTWRHPIELARQEMRQRIDARLPASDHAGWISALVTGDQNAIARADWDVFRATGVAHLMSISGLHITMFAWLAGRLTGVAWRRSARLCLCLPAPQAALVGGLALACGYAVFSGWGVPSRRTIWMLAWVSLLRLSGRRWPWPLAWA